MVKKNEDEWNLMATSLIKSLLALDNVKYKELSNRLKGIGIDITPSALSNRISNGKFSAAFLLQVMHVLNRKHLTIPERKDH